MKTVDGIAGRSEVTEAVCSRRRRWWHRAAATKPTRKQLSVFPIAPLADSVCHLVACLILNIRLC